MHVPFYAQEAVSAGNPSSHELMEPDVMPPNKGYIFGNGDIGLSARASDSLMRHQFQNAPGSSKRDEFNNRLLDPEIMELYYRSCMQEEEILLLRKQVNDACTKELQLLNEKHILERKLCELRIALDEKQDDAIASALKELTKKRSYFEENLRLANNLKVVEEEMSILTSSLLSLLAEYDIRPPQINSSTINYGIKQLYQHMHWKIRSYEPTIPELRLYDQYPMNLHGKLTSNQLRATQDCEKMAIKDANMTPNSEMPFAFVNEKRRDFSTDIYKEVGGIGAPNSSEGYVHELTPRTSIANAQFHMAAVNDNQVSFVSEGEFDLPSIEGFQIYGEAQPACKLQACGYPTNGTTLCIFQWVRELDNGTRQYIEGASVPEYVVTADDVDTILAVDCTPIDDSGRQGDLVRQFANNQNKITCDPEMQHEIDSYISAGKAIFNVKLWKDSSDWEKTVLIVKRSAYLIKANHTEGVLMEEKYSPELKIKVPLGYTTQFVLTCSDGTNLPLTTDGICQPNSMEHDVRLRDIIVLTMRYFQSKFPAGLRC